MNIPHPVVDVIYALRDKYQPNFKDPSWAETYRFTKMLCAQLRFNNTLGLDWVYLTHPEGHSDKFGYVDGNTVHYWDYVISSGGPGARLNNTGIYSAFSLGMYDIDREPAKDYLADESKPPIPTPGGVSQEEFRQFKLDLSDKLSDVYNIIESLIVKLRS